jgi:hypothetical protein
MITPSSVNCPRYSCETLYIYEVMEAIQTLHSKKKLLFITSILISIMSCEHQGDNPVKEEIVSDPLSSELCFPNGVVSWESVEINFDQAKKAELATFLENTNTRAFRRYLL